jgi:hypothetical protein
MESWELKNLREKRKTSWPNGTHSRDSDTEGLWKIYDSSLLPTLNPEIDKSFDTVFDGLYPEGMDIKKFVETALESKKGKAVGLEIGGPGKKLFQGFDKGLFEKSFGVVLEKWGGLDENSSEDSNHKIITADALSSNGYVKIKDALGDSRVNFLVEKMHGGLDEIPSDLDFMQIIAQRWYRLLDDEAIMLLETPSLLDKYGKTEEKKLSDIQNWIKKISETNGISAKSKTGSYDGIWKLSLYILIQKHKGAPDKLPFD